MSKRPRIEFKKEQSKRPIQQYSTQRYIVMGGILGLYFGWFFEPRIEPRLSSAVFMSLVISLALLVLPRILELLALMFPSLKTETPPFLTRLKQFPINVVQYFLILVLLQGRHFLHDWGGRGAVVTVGVLAGCAFGYWFKIRRERFGF